MATSLQICKEGTQPMMLVPLRKRHSVGLGMLDLAFKYPPAAVPGAWDVGPDRRVPGEGAPRALAGSRPVVGENIGDIPACRGSSWLAAEQTGSNPS